MEDISKRIAALSPAKRALLQQILRAKSSSGQQGNVSKKSLTASRERPARLPLSYAQQRLWFLDRLEGSSTEYNIREAWRLQGELDCTALERALNAVIARHETLRTYFVEEDGEPSQVIEPAVYLPVAIEDVSALTKDDREQAIVENTRAEAERPFDLGRGPLLRARLLKLGEREHVFFCTFHHIIFDGWSVAVFSQDLSVFYEAFRRGEESAALKALPVQYADYALWQRERLEGEELERQLAYWKSQLADAAALALPTDLARPVQPSFAGGRHSLVLGPEIAARLKELSRQENATLFMTLLAAFQLLLCRYSGQEDISVGIPAANRNHVELEELIGFFLDTLVLRTDLSGAPCFRELLRRVQKVTLEAYAHADVPFEKLVQELQPERSLNQTPLFQAFVNYLSFEDQPVRLAGLQAEKCLKEGLKSKFDLTLYIRERPRGIFFTVAYSTELFLPETIAAMMRHFENLLAAIVANPEERIGALPMLEAKERRLGKVSEQAVRPATPYVYFAREEIEQSIVARFAQQVRAAPEQLAVDSGSWRWTYQELDQRSERIAQGLVRHCGDGEEHIALLLEHDAPMIAATLGVFKAGKAYVPLDGAYPVGRLAQMIADSQVRTLLSDEANAALAQELSAAAGISVLPLAELEAAAEGPPLALCGAESTAYLLYTSGSTGEPKAITQSHRNVLHHIASYTNSLHLSGGDRLLLIASLGVDAAVQDIFGALLNGATVCPYDVRRHELGALAQWMAQEEITVFHATPSLYRYFVAALDEQPGRWSFPKLRLVVLGGEKVVPSDLELYKEHFEAGCLLVNGYGLSESTVSLQCFFDMAYEQAGASLPIGTPVEETEVMLLNAQGDPGQVCGEIALASRYLAQGYWGRAELSAAAFVSDPYNPGRRIYRTGDLGRLLPSGLIEFVGRRDFQLKIRGYRVEGQEIELLLAKHEQVAQAAVLAGYNQRGEPELIGYVVPRAGCSITSRQVREFAAQWLPTYMVPQAILILEKMPLTASGKIDRQALRLPEDLPGTAPQSYVAPGTPTQQSLAEIWSELLKRDQPGIHDDFFECGGHSLLATRLVSRIRRAFDVELPLRSVFEGPTIAAMSELVDTLGHEKLSGLEGALVGPRRSLELTTLPERPARLPLSYAQQRLWFLDKLEGSSIEYNLRKALRLKGELDCPALERALHALLTRHETLRTRFDEEDGEPSQVIEPAVHLPLVVEDLSALEPAESERRVELAMRAEADTPFDLYRGPLVRVRLLKVAEREHVFLCTFHHIIFDGWSSAVFFRDLSVFYEAFRRGEESAALKALPVQYADYALWQRERLEGEELERQLAYWKSQLADAAALALPTDLARPLQPSFAGGRHSLVLGPEIAARLKELSRQENATLFMTLLAAFQLLLCRYSGQEDISVGIPAANRNHVELEELIGFFLDTLVLRTDLSGAPCFRELLRRVQKVTLEAYAHADVPFEKLVQELQPERSLNQTPLFQAFVNYLSFEDQPVRLAGLQAEKCLKEGLKSKFDLTLYIREGDYGVYLTLIYQTALFSSERMANFLDQFEHLVSQIVENPGCSVQSYSLITEKTRELLPDPGVALSEPEQIPVTSRILSLATHSPDCIALRHEDREWTFQDLARSATDIAALLAARGVQPRDVVAVSGPRSFGLISGIVGVLLTRGVLLTLDPSLPAARRDLMVQAASAKHWLSISDSSDETEPAGEALASLPRTTISSQGTCPEPILRASTITSNVDPEDPAYIFFTSGTTGVPKGILGVHKALSHFLQWEQQALSFTPGDRVAQLTGLSFDVVLRDIFLPLTTGATLCLPDTDLVPHSAGVTAWLQRERITVLHMVPSLAAAWLDAAKSCTGLPDLRWVLMAGEPLTDTLVGRWRETMGRAHGIVNLYGPTETTLAKCAYCLPENPLPGVQPVGRPLPDTQALVLNKADQLCGIGEPGEIVIRTPFRTLGYLNGAQELRVSFVSNPFRNDPRDVIYRTGDRGSYSSEGLVRISGRLDDQVKIRGVRVEPAEVAAVLARSPEVQRCAVVAREDSDGDKCLVAYVVQKSPDGDVGALRDFLKQMLPEYMIPAAFVTLDKLPLTPNGKLDRKALPAPTRRTAALYVAPRNALEERLAQIWSELLKLEKAGVYDDFFESGGHSLLATRLVSRIRRALDVEVPLRAVFEGPTIAALGRFVQAVEHEKLAGPGVTVRTSRPLDFVTLQQRPTRLPLSYAQQRLWFLDKLEGSSTEYNIREACRLKGELDYAALQRAVDAVVSRHEILRTRFMEEDGEPFQVIEANVHVPVISEDLGALSAGERERAVSAAIRGEAEAAFDLGSGPLLRVKLLRLEEREHVLLCAFHHIIFDGWSVAIFSRDLSALYEAFRRGEDNPLKALAIQYADYALWQRQRLEAEEWQRQLAYWKSQLADAPALAMPTDLPRPLRPSFAGARHSLILVPEIAGRLKELSRQENVTLFMTLLAAFQVLLSRYSCQEDISVGIPAANRNHVELEEMIGFFLDTLVLRSDLQGNPSFRELLRRVKKVILDAYAHAEVPFEKLVQELQPERSLNQTPLFQAFVNFLSFENEPVSLAGLQTERCLKENLKSKFDLTLHIREGHYGLVLSFAYSTELFLPETIAAMMRHFENLLAAIVANPEERIGALPMLEAKERRLGKVSEQAVRPATPYVYFAREEIEQSIVARFAQQVRAAPEQLAVDSGSWRWTYQELDQRSERIAQGLVRHCGDGEEHIALLLEHDAPMIAATLGVLKAGKAYVPLDGAYPVGRLAQMIADSQVRTLLSDEANAALAQELSATAGISVLPLAELEAAAEGPPLALCGAESTAYLLYTSGSTGEPKAITQSHRNVLHHIASYTNSLHLSGGDRLLLIASLGVDAAVQDIFGALLNGATVCPYDVRRHELGALAQWMAQEEITVFHATPSLYRYFVAALDEQPGRWSFPKLRLVVLGGEKVVPSDLELYKEHFEAGCLLVNGYGLSESTVSLQCFFDMAYEQAGASLPIGTPVEETEVMLLNAQGDPGQVCGEIALASRYLAQGYWGRAELSAAAFVSDPYNPGRRIYRTGDLGRLLPSGLIEFVGRRDFQLKIRGYRVEGQEIELLLAKHEQVAQAAVLAGYNQRGEPELIGYVVPRAGCSITSRQVREFAAQWLPTYMVPQAILILEKMPLTASGKIDRQALRLPEDLPGTAPQSYVAPGTPTQQSLAEIWSELLKRDQPGIHDDFFECGGHSLLATRLVSRIRRAFDVELPLRSVFEGPTIAAMSELVDTLGHEKLSGLEGALVGPRRSLELTTLPERPARLPLSYAQQRLWFLDKLEGSSIEYNLRKALRLKGELDCPALERALHALLTRHETLRTRFDEEDGEPSQVIEPAVHLPLVVEDLSALEPAESERRVELAMRAEADTPFDLYRGPLVRVRLLKVAEREHVFLCTFHHIIFDGWSSAVFFRDLSVFYEAFRRGEESAALKALPVQYADYALWQRERLEGEELERQLAYWKSQLADAAALALPTDLARPLQPSFAGGRHSLVLGPEIAARLKELSRQENATLFMTLLAAFQLLLCRYSGQEDISVGIPAANRNHVELEELIGFFLDTLVLRTDLSGAPCFRELLRRVQKVTLEAYAHADVPFEKLVQELQPERSLNQTPLFQAFVNYLSFEDQPVRLAGLQAEKCLKEGLKSKFDLTLYIRERPRGIFFTVAYSTELFLPETIAAMMRHFENLLAAIVANPEERIGALPMLEAKERRLGKVSEQAVRPATPYVYFAREEIEQSIVARFAQQVRAAPEQLAVDSGSWRWTYQELDQRSERIAQGLVRHCGDGEEHIALLLEHDAPMIAATLGVFKAGKAYVPLDGAYPVGRLAQMIADSQVRTLLSDEANAALAQELSATAGISVLPLAELETSAEGPPLALCGAESTAYLLYTSGSTGEPKAITQSHRNVLHHIASYTNSLHLSGGDRLLLIASLGVDAAVQDIFGALLNGATVCPYDVRRHELGALAQWMAQEEITVFHATPSLYRYFVAALDEQPGRWSFPKLRLVVLGGEKVVPSDLELYKEHFEAGCLLVNGYGLSESTVSLQCFFDMAYEQAGASLPIGTPVEETEVMLLNAQGDPGQVCGEIALASRYLAQGYWGRAELSAAAFVSDPNNPGRRIYRTGDLGRLLPSGLIEFVGRRDFQLKIRGYRVEGQEIELLLAKHEQVAQAAVLAGYNQRGEPELIGYVVPRAGCSITSRQVREFAAQWLPTYMVPQAILILEKMPLTASGKIDRQALRLPEDLPGTAPQSYVAPGTPTQQSLAEIWSELLKRDQPGIHDDFFECGGHSLLATRLVSRIRRAFDVELPLRSVFEGPTIAALSELVENIRWVTGGFEPNATTEQREEIVL